MPSGPTVVLTFEEFESNGLSSAAVSDTKYEKHLNALTCPFRWIPEDGRYTGSNVEVTFDLERPSHEKSVDVRDTTDVITAHAEFTNYKQNRFWKFLIRDGTEVVSVGYLGDQDWLPSWVTPEENEATLTMQMTYRHEQTMEKLDTGEAEIEKQRRKTREWMDDSTE